MSEGSRPGGLTALAVLNFVLAGLGLIIWILAWAAMGALEAGFDAAVTQEGVTLDAEIREGMNLAWLRILLGFLSCGLLIASGVGYLGLKKMLGWKLGNAYAILALLVALWGILAGAGFGIGTIIYLIYPVLTLALLNTTFKNDFINP